MLNAIGKIFSQGKINRDAILANCSLGRMTFLRFDFRPWEKKVTPEYSDVSVSKVEVFKDGIYATVSDENLRGAYVGRIDDGICGWCGIFNTLEEAERCFCETMNQWKNNIQ